MFAFFRIVQWDKISPIGGFEIPNLGYYTPSVQRYDQQITGPYYKQLLHDCLNNTFMHGQHVAYHGNCPL